MTRMQYSDKLKIGSIDFMAVLTAMRDPAKNLIPGLIKEAHLSFCPYSGPGKEMRLYLYLIISTLVLSDTLVTHGGQICAICRHEKKCTRKVFQN